MAEKGIGQLPKGTLKLDFAPPEVKKAIMRLKMQGKSVDYISKYIKKQYGFSAQWRAITKFLKRRTDLGPKMLFQREEYVNELESQYVETLSEFKKLVEFTWTHVKEMKKEAAKGGGLKAKSEVLKGIQELRQQIALANDLMGALPKADKAAVDAAQAVHLALQKIQKEDKERAEGTAKRNMVQLEEPVKIKIPGADDCYVTRKVGIPMEED